MPVIRFPKPASHCKLCGRPLDGRVSNPYAPWSIPVNGSTCSLCDESNHDDVTKRDLPESSRIALNAYLKLGVAEND